MKILNIVNSANPEHGGVIAWVHQLCREAPNLGHIADTLTLDNGNEPWIKEFPGRIYTTGGRLGEYYSPNLNKWLHSNASNYDAVLIHGIWRYASLGSWLTLRKTATPYFVYPHGMLDPWFREYYPIKHLLKSIYWPFSEYKVMRDAAGIIYTCENEQKKADHAFWPFKTKNNIIASIGISPPPGNPDTQKELFIQRYPQLKGKKILLFLGRIHEKKGIDMLIHAYSKFKNYENIHLVIAGPVTDEKRYAIEEIIKKHAIENKITWTGMLSGDVKWGAFFSANAFILPSHQENFGISVVEALACGIPVLISDKVDIHEEIRKDAAGIIAPDTIEGTEYLIKKWISINETEYKVLSNNAIKCYKSRFASNTATMRLFEEIKKHIGK